MNKSPFNLKLLNKCLEMRSLFIVFIMILTGCSSTRYYIVRHAEKMVMQKDSLAMMANNPPLSEAGKVRAFVLRDELKNKNIGTKVTGK